MTPIEIERKLIIEKPSEECLRACDSYTVSEIEQIYLHIAKGECDRIRRREYPTHTVCTRTVKHRIDNESCYEDEHEISREEYDALSKSIMQGTRPVRKRRHTFIYLGKTIEIDIYPEWERCAVLECELSARGESFSLPEFIRVLRDVTGDARYSNAALSQHFVPEDYL